MTLGEQAKVEYSTKNIPFNKVKLVVDKLNAVTSLHDVANKISIEERVNVVGYINQSNPQVEPIQTKYRMKRKKEVIIYDNACSESVRLTLWNAFIDTVSKDGVYIMQDLRLKSYEGKYLTTIATTVVKESDAVIEKKNFTAPNSFDTVQFPPEIINIFQEAHFCKKMQ